MTVPGDTPLLSVLMPTLVRRETMFVDLATRIAAQAEASYATIEVVGLQNAGEKPLAEYREDLLRDARGTFLCFVDDDDDVPDYYVEEIVKALTVNPDVVAWEQYGTGTASPRTLFGLEFLGCPYEPVMLDDGNTAYLRVYSHMQPIRSEIAKQGSFVRKGRAGFTGEDYAFAQMVVPLLLERGGRQYRIRKVMYSYLWLRTGESTQGGLQTPEEVKAAAGHVRPVIASPCFRWYGT